jgi:methionyl-tRNA synthetase
MLKKYCQSTVPQLSSADFSSDHPLKSIGMTLGDRVVQAYENLQVSQACTAVLSLVRAVNKYIDDSAPWKLFKQKEQTEVEQILYAVLESIRLSAYLLSPVIPSTSSKIYQQLGFNCDFNQDQINQAVFSSHSKWGELSISKALGQASPVFLKLELPLED